MKKPFTPRVETSKKFPHKDSRTTFKKESPSSYVKKTNTKDTYSKKTYSNNKESKSNLLAPSPQSLKSTPTSWGGVAEWYDSHLVSSDDTYHAQVIFPNLLRILGEIDNKKIIDLACGQGLFTQKLADAKAHAIGIDISSELIAIAKKNIATKKKHLHTAEYFVTPSDDLYMIRDRACDIVVCVLALQNIENIEKTIQEVSRVLVPGGRFICVLNHPMFRNPRKTHWGYDEATQTQFRRVDEYMSESHIKIDMTPGSKTDKKYTMSFHRPLQMYMKAFTKNGLLTTRLEEWVSHRESKSGPKQRAENNSRKEIPLFMCIELIKSK